MGNAAAAIAGGLADCVVVFRALAQGQFARFGRGAPTVTVTGEAAFTFPYGLISPAQRFAMRVMRFMHDHGVRQETLRAIALASYHHAQANPRAVMHGRPLTPEMYDASRWIVEPFRLFDCCLENDGAAALILVAAERARDLRARPVYLLGVAQGSEHRNGAPVHNAPLYATSSFTTVAPHLYAMAGVSPKDVNVRAELRELHGRRAYESGRARLLCVRGRERGVHGRASHRPQRDDSPLTRVAAIWPSATCTASSYSWKRSDRFGGNRPTRCPARTCRMVCSGPMVTPVSSLIFGSEATL